MSNFNVKNAKKLSTLAFVLLPSVLFNPGLARSEKERITDQTDQEELDGEFGKNGECIYPSECIYPGENIYKEEYRNGLRDENGKYIYPNGGIYEEEYKNGLRDGKGKYTYLNGGIYEGEYKNGKEDGRGKYIYSNGGIYEGEYRNGLRDGKGKYTYLNGDIYEGEYRNGKKNGKGKIIYKSGVTIEGNFSDGKLEKKTISNVNFGENGVFYDISGGKITCNFPEGISFRVSFEKGYIRDFVEYDDKKVEVKFDKQTGWSTVDEGRGIYVNRKGEFFRGKLGANTDWSVKGTLFGLDGSICEGKFDRNGRISEGKITQANGSYEWRKLKIIGRDSYVKKIEENGSISEASAEKFSLLRGFRLKNNGIREYFYYDKYFRTVRDTLLDGPETYGEGERAGQINFKKIDDTRKLSSCNFGLYGFFSKGSVTYYSYGADGNLEATVEVDYGELNRVLSGKIENGDILFRSGAIVVSPPVKTFEEAQSLLQRVQKLMFENRFQRGAQGFEGGAEEEVNLGILANLKDLESLKGVRFQKPGFKTFSGGDYGSPTKFLESLGIDAENIKNIEEDFISVSVGLRTGGDGHAVALVIDIGKIKEIIDKNGFMGIDKSGEILFKCFDSGRAVAMGSWKKVLAGIVKNVALVENSVVQIRGSCWEHSMITAIAAAENRGLLGGIESTSINSIFYGFIADREYARAVLGNPVAVAQLHGQLKMLERNKVYLGTDKNLLEYIVSPIIIYLLEEFSKKEKLLEEYDQRVQSIGGGYLEDKDGESVENFEKLIRERREELSREITDEKEETEKRGKELKKLEEAAEEDWRSLSGYLETEYGKFGEGLDGFYKDFDIGIKYDPTMVGRMIDLAKTIAKKLDAAEEQNFLGTEIEKIEKSNRAYVEELLRGRTRVFERGLENTKKLNERTEFLRGKIKSSRVGARFGS
ncbi:MAG: hypothetical protein LBI70_02850 [Rickettsiales bacterium]|nr:hypothetical protein [Rickettsiales bacterium]